MPPRLLAAPIGCANRVIVLCPKCTVPFPEDTTELWPDPAPGTRSLTAHKEGDGKHKCPRDLAGIHANPMAGTAIKSGHGALQMMKCSCKPANNRGRNARGNKSGRGRGRPTRYYVWVSISIVVALSMAMPFCNTAVTP
jgi:hypothetical protein